MQSGEGQRVLILLLRGDFLQPENVLRIQKTIAKASDDDLLRAMTDDAPRRSSAHASDDAPAQTHRRHHSEIDMSSLRRISEALLLAQNRARLATERANRCERYVHVSLSMHTVDSVDALTTLMASVLRMVLAQVNPQLTHSIRSELTSSSSNTLALSDWDLMQSMTQQQQQQTTPVPDTLTVAVPSVESHQLLYMSAGDAVAGLSPTRRHSFDVRDRTHDTSPSYWNGSDARHSEHDTAMHTPERDVDVAALAKEIVANLHAAAVRSDQRVQKLHKAIPSGATFRPAPRSSKLQVPDLGTSADTNWLETWKHRLFRIELAAMTPLQFVAGILVGVVVGMTVTKQLLLRRADDGGSTSQLLTRLATCYKRRAGQPAATLRNFPFGVDDDAMRSYYVHPAAVEVA